MFGLNSILSILICVTLICKSEKHVGDKNESDSEEAFKKYLSAIIGMGVCIENKLCPRKVIFLVNLY